MKLPFYTTAILFSSGSYAATMRRALPDFTTSEAGNPFVDGWYADPDTCVYKGQYWVFPTSSYAYDEQTYLDAFSSTDLVHWTKHADIITKAQVSWANRAMWAPAHIERDGKYYLYFAANDIQEGEKQVGGIGVAVADQPEGPYKDAIGKPLIGEYYNGAQPIDQDVFIDDDGQAYIYYGGHAHANVAKLNSDMVSIGTFSDGSQFKEITPENYVEGSLMFKRNGKYYLMWSEGGWTGPDYSVSYAISDSPIGPFNREAKILQQDTAVATGSGHNGVIKVPGTDIWYIFYHRRPLGDSDGNHRHLAYDRMYFNEDGTIKPVTMLVKDNFEDGNLIGWNTSFEGSFSVKDGKLKAEKATSGKALQNTGFEDLVFDIDIALVDPDVGSNAQDSGDAGVLFGVTSASAGIDSLTGFYAAIDASGEVVLGQMDQSWTQLASAQTPIQTGTDYHLRVTVINKEVKVFVDDMSAPKLTHVVSKSTKGTTGVRVFRTGALYDNLSVAHPQ
ncbi:endo-1,4-beta-xylanase D precursor [Colletotrichum abscissum]|uniref:Endo-1,4-beta-xylanase D n=1 Tax=Colletotrichum abscissum TaxID=1671311 RepID=A0A9Q0B007_9PEZI|nr:endo-1,4-beta-xylanase D precursor [Colletotrichum abscissum]KAI3550410.1 endo-1,4-beta-xylanase D precursor [Colletotrichum abscissum]KAK1485776.1 endo-1,4-beta-xylanase D precursor [Colletotrichum abscissum]